MMRVWLSQTLRLPIFPLFPSYPSCLFSQAPSPINRRLTHCILQVEINRRRVTLHKYCVSLSECYLLTLCLILMRMKLSSGGLPLILMVTTHQVSWTSLSFSISFLLPLSFIFSFHFMFIVFVSFIVLLSVLSLSIEFYIHSHHFMFNVFCSLPLWNEPSHLLNHLVKLISSGDFPKVFTLIFLKSQSK